MFNPAASLAHLGLLFALLWRLIAPSRGRPTPAAWRALARIERELAQAARATLADAGLYCPDTDDRTTIAWFNASRHLLHGVSTKAQPARAQRTEKPAPELPRRAQRPSQRGGAHFRKIKTAAAPRSNARAPPCAHLQQTTNRLGPSPSAAAGAGAVFS